MDRNIYKETVEMQILNINKLKKPELVKYMK